MLEVSAYPYCDADGVLLYEVVRFEPKAFRQRRADGEWNVNGVPRVLYRLPEVLMAVAAGRTVIVVEGEKDVEALRSRGFVATCNSGGAGQWRAEYGEALRDADVVIVPDGDEVGERHAIGVARTLVAPRVLRLGAKDVSEWFAAGGTVEAFAELVRGAPLWTPVGEGACKKLDGDAHSGPVGQSLGWMATVRDWSKSVARWSAEESYALTACRNARARVERASKGDRTQTLNDEALGLGYLVDLGWLERARAAGELFCATTVNGLLRGEGAARVQAIILRGLQDGTKTRRSPISLSIRSSFHAGPFLKSENCE